MSRPADNNRRLITLTIIDASTGSRLFRKGNSKVRSIATQSILRNDRDSESCHGVLSGCLLSEIAVLLERQTTRLQECRNLFPRRRRVIDAERSEWLTEYLQNRSCVPHEEGSRLEYFGREIVERDDGATGCSGNCA